MADKFSKEVRSKIMKSIKGKNTKPELVVETILKSLRYKFQKHVSDLPGKPDFVLKNYPIVIQVNGCFWHGCKKCFKMPKSNGKFWKNKIKKNIERDRINTEKLLNRNFGIIEIWEHELKEKKIREKLYRYIIILKTMLELEKRNEKIHNNKKNSA